MLEKLLSNETTAPVETIEEFKLRIAAMLQGKRELIQGAGSPNPLLVGKKRSTVRKRRTPRVHSRAWTLTATLRQLAVFDAPAHCWNVFDSVLDCSIL